MQHTVRLLPSGDLEFQTANGRLLRIPMQLATTEVPWPEPENDLATLWCKRARTAEAAFLILRRMLQHVEEHPDQPLAYPTQHVIDAIGAVKRIDWTQREPVVSHTVIGEAIVPQRKRKPTIKAFGKGKPPALDISTIDFDI